MMWNKVEQSISSGDKSINLLAGGDINFSISANFPTALVDQRIDEELSIVQKSR